MLMQNTLVLNEVLQTHQHQTIRGNPLICCWIRSSTFPHMDCRRTATYLKEEHYPYTLVAITII